MKFFYPLLLKSIIFLLGIYSIACHSIQIQPQTNFEDKRHIGHWSGNDVSGRHGELFLFPNGFAAFVAGGQGFGGPTMNKTGGLLYQINYTKNPIHLDLVNVNREFEEQRRIKIIIEFKNSKEMKACTFMNSERPKSFDEAKNCFRINLARVN